MSRSAPLASECRTDLTALLLMGSIRSAVSVSSKPLCCQLAEPVAKAEGVLVHVSAMPLIPAPQCRAQLCRQKMLNGLGGSR